MHRLPSTGATNCSLSTKNQEGGGKHSKQASPLWIPAVLKLRRGQTQLSFGAGKRQPCGPLDPAAVQQYGKTDDHYALSMHETSGVFFKPWIF